jgi:hypothetical protein
LQDDDIGGFKLNMYDYGFRNYDPALGRWMNQTSAHLYFDVSLLFQNQCATILPQNLNGILSLKILYLANVKYFIQ